MDYTEQIEEKLIDNDDIKISLKIYVNFWAFIARNQLLSFVLYGLFLVFMSSLTPLSTYIWHQYIDSATTIHSFSKAFLILVSYIVVLIIVDYCYFFSMRFMEKINFNSWRVLDYTINEKATKLKYEYYEVPNIQNRVNRAWEFSHGSYVQMYQLGLETIRQFIQLIGIFVSLYIINPTVCLVSLLTIIPAIASKLINDKLSFYSNRHLSDEENELRYYENAILDQSLIKEIILNSAFSFFLSKYKTKAREIHNKKIVIETKKSRLLLLEETTRNTIIITCILFSSYSFITGSISIGGIAVVFTLVVTLIYTLSGFVSSSCSVFTLTYKIKQFYEFIDVDTQENNIKCQNLDLDINSIKMDKVYYRYPLTNTYILNNLNICINKGQHIAIVGANGSGKTTFVKLIAKLIEPSLGSVFINNLDIKSIDNQQYWSALASVFQDYNKHKESLRYNVGIGNPSCIHDDTKINNALYNSGFTKNIQLNCMLSKEYGGIELSGGEWQKIAIARSLLKDNCIFIFDEPTAAIDPIMEAELYEKFSILGKNKTCLFVTHRLGSVLFSDLILFFKEGIIIESGTHKDLLLLNGEYAKFWNTQAKLYELT